MKRNETALAIIAALVAACLAVNLQAQDGPPLQANVRVWVNRNQDGSDNLGTFFRRRLEGGGATVSGRVQNLPARQTALVTLRFRYRTKADIALDELVSRIVISIEDANGNEFSTVTIDPNTVPLNPNRVPLYYSATLYTPPVARGRQGYIAHVKIYGNYE